MYSSVSPESGPVPTVAQPETVAALIVGYCTGRPAAGGARTAARDRPTPPRRRRRRPGSITARRRATRGARRWRRAGRRATEKTERGRAAREHAPRRAAPTEIEFI